MLIFENQTTNGEFPFIKSLGVANSVFLKGNFERAFVYIEFSPDGGDTWYRDIECTYTSIGISSFKTSINKKVLTRVIVENASPGTNITMHIT